MITQIDIAGFRSIKDQKIRLKKFNILYGPNGSGKSSVMYAAYVMRNFFVNPNQRLNSLFNLGFINLGGFDNVVYNKDNSLPVSLRICCNRNLKIQLLLYKIVCISIVPTTVFQLLWSCKVLYKGQSNRKTTNPNFAKQSICAI